MHAFTEPLHSRATTGRRMYALSIQFSKDLKAANIRRNSRPVTLDKLLLRDFYVFVQKIPYRRDDKPIEVIARPLYLLRNASGGLDCKKRAILLGAWFQQNGLKPLKQWRFVAVSTKRNGEIHHVYPQIKLNGQWRNVDATYRYMKLFQPKKVTAFQVLKP